MKKLACFWAAVVFPCAAQTALTVQDAIQRALEIHPLLAASAQRRHAAEGLRLQAGLAPNPRLVLQSENTRPYGNPSFVYLRDTDNFVYLQNTFETAGKRERRRDLADTAVDRSGHEIDLLRTQIAARVASTYWIAAGARRVHQLLLDDARTLEGVVEYHRVRVREGAMAEADLIRVRLEAQRMAVTVNLANLDAERGRIHLQREMGETAFDPVTLSDAVDRADRPPDAGLEQALRERAEIRLAQAAVRQAMANQRLQTVNAKPNVDVLFGYKRTAGFDTMIGGVQVDLPFANRNQGNIAASAAEIRVANSNLAATEALIRAEVQAAGMDYRMRRRDVIDTLRPTLESAAETYRIADAAYRAGGTDLLRLLDAQRVRTESQIAFARALTDLRLSETALRVSLGMEP